jgi:hypothetical protein
MDFCACDHCRSMLSPAAYLVDLLQFIDVPRPERGSNPQMVLFGRRPDIEYLPLTCENTNTALPYIDIVNETMEFFVHSGAVSLQGYEGHDTGDLATEDLLASPQFVMDEAYQTLAAADFPPPLPFNLPLEGLRQYFAKLEVPLAKAMELLRADDSLERSPGSYAWCDILMERIALSRREYLILSDLQTVSVNAMYGLDGNADPVAELSNAKGFSRRLNLSYDDLFALLRTRFINPHCDLLPKLERLRVPFAVLAALKNGTLSDDAFRALLPQGTLAPNPAEYGEHGIVAWVTDDANYARIMGLITLADPTQVADSGGLSATCNFDRVEFRRAEPIAVAGDPATRLGPIAFVRLLRFIRLWRKLGWTIEQTDTAISALLPLAPGETFADTVKDGGLLDAGFMALLPRLGIIVRALEALRLSPDKGLLPLLACFADIGTHGASALYRRMFLNPAILKLDEVYDDHGSGLFLTDPNEKISAHREALRAAFNLTGEEFQTLLGWPGVYLDAAGGPDDSGDPHLTLANVSAMFRRGWLARALRLSLREFLLLTAATGLDPFALPDPTRPALLHFIALVDRLRGVSLKPAEALYLVWNQDLSGKSAPREDEVYGLARTLRAGLISIEAEFAVVDDPDGALARNRMALVYGTEATDTFFAFLENTFVTEAFYRTSVAPVTQVRYKRGPASLLTAVSYTHGSPTLESAILDVAPGQISYDDFAKQLAFTAELTTSIRDALKGVAGVTEDFKETVERLFRENRMIVTAGLEQAIVDAAPDQIAYTDNVDAALARLAFTGVMTSDIRDRLKSAAGVTAEFKEAVDRLYAENRAIVSANLPQDIVEVVPGRIAYDDLRKRLSYTGVLVDNIHATLRARGDQSFKDAIDWIYEENQRSVNAFFDRYPDLPHGDADWPDVGHPVAEKRAALLAAILPDLIRRRKRQLALQAVAPAAADAGLARAVLEDPEVLHAAAAHGTAAVDDLTAVERLGLFVQFFRGEQASGPVFRSVDTEPSLAYTADGGHPLPDNHGDPVSGIWDGYLEAPRSGFFNFQIDADAGATPGLRLAGRTVALAHDAGGWTNVDPVELRAGTLYPLVLTVEKVKDQLRVRWSSAGRGWETIPATQLYSAILIGRLRRTYTDFAKAASLAGALKLSAPELAWLAARSEYRIVKGTGARDPSGQGWLNLLPGADSLLPNTGVARTLNTSLGEILVDLLDYARIKAEISPADESLLTCLQDPVTTATVPDGLLYAITRWDGSGLGALLARFGASGQAGVASLSRIPMFRRVYDAFTLVRTSGIAAGALLQSATNTPDGDTVRKLEAALRARYDADAWRVLTKPINDQLRGRRREALIAFILHKLPASRHIDTADKLFEFFLMDVQMEPCMQTSRIRHALSSVQLFIERCLMNLEPDVAPQVIDVKRWEWMKRYRVWEANRKVFLFPENWLEPELRDDQSPFFRETMSELLQGDITEDSAATAMLNYLAKLEEVAKLEPCGIHYVPDDPDTLAQEEVTHVVARTAGIPRHYFYRRREFGRWTPWEQIKLGIEDDPVIPVVWKGRLFLFWLRILNQMPLDAYGTAIKAYPLLRRMINIDSTTAGIPAASDGDNGGSASCGGTTQSGPAPATMSGSGIDDKKLFDSFRASTVDGAPKNTHRSAILCWSEYYNDKWQATNSTLAIFA